MGSKVLSTYLVSIECPSGNVILQYGSLVDVDESAILTPKARGTFISSYPFIGFLPSSAFSLSISSISSVKGKGRT